MIKSQTRQLFKLLEQNEGLTTKGFSLCYTQTGRIIIDRSGHVHGMWDFDGDTYTWVSPSSSEPMFRTGDARSAVLYTLAVLRKV